MGGAPTVCRGHPRGGIPRTGLGGGGGGGGLRGGAVGGPPAQQVCELHKGDTIINIIYLFINILIIYYIISNKCANCNQGNRIILIIFFIINIHIYYNINILIIYFFHYLLQLIHFKTEPRK